MTSQPLARDEEDPAGVPIVPAPWTFKGIAHVMGVALPCAMGPKEQFVPPDEQGRKGGVGTFAYARYTDSGVGPYEELLWLPVYGVKIGGRWCSSVTRIFVSTRASMVNGRRNWGIPKRVAEFHHESIGARAERVRVSLGGKTLASFAVSWTEFAFPTSTWDFTKATRTLAQQLDGKRFYTAPESKGLVHLAHFDEMHFDPLEFPDVTRGWTLMGATMTNLDMVFPKATVVPVIGR